MSYHSELDRQFRYEVRLREKAMQELEAKEVEIAALKEQLNLVLSGAVSRRSYENTLEELDAATEVAEAVVAERDALVTEMGKLRENNKELRRSVAKVKGLLVNEGKVIDVLVSEKAQLLDERDELKRQLDSSKTWERYFQNGLDNSRINAEKLVNKLDELALEKAQLVTRRTELQANLKDTVEERDSLMARLEAQEETYESQLADATNAMYSAKRDADRANEKAQKMTDAWKALDREVQNNMQHIDDLREELAMFKHITKDLTLEDIRVARALKMMYATDVRFEQCSDYYNEYTINVSFTLYPRAKSTLESDLWKALKGVQK